MSQRVTIKVDGMTCGGCESSVKAALERLDGVEVLEVSHQEGTVEVMFDADRIDQASLAGAIEEAGFDVVAV